MTALMLLYRRDPRQPGQLAEAVARFKQRTGQEARLIGVAPGTQPPAGEHNLQVVEDRPLNPRDFWIGIEA